MEEHAIRVDRGLAAAVDENVSPYLLQPVRSMAKALQDRSRSRRQFTEAEAKAKRLAKTPPSTTLLRLVGAS